MKSINNNKPTPEGRLPIWCEKNPLVTGIANLPLTVRSLYDAIARLENVPEERHRADDKMTRFFDLAAIENFYSPPGRDLETAAGIVRMIMKGYADRVPNPSFWREHLAKCASLADLPGGRPTFISSAASRAIIGTSGSGKSTSVENLLSRIPPVVTHDRAKDKSAPLKQIVWLKVACPVNQSPRAFITGVFNQMDAMLGSTYADGHYRENDEELIGAVAAKLRVHFVGILVIDEIQNVVGQSKKADRRLLKLLVNITNTLGIPIVFIGTPRSEKLLNQELANARRMMGPLWLPYKADDVEWKLFLNALWEYQFTRTFTPLNDTLRATLHDLTQGIPALAKALFTLAQERLIFNSTPKDKEIITDPVLRTTFAEQMRSVEPAVAALRTGLGLEVFDDLLPKKLPKPAAWEADRVKAVSTAKDLYLDSMMRAARKAGREDGALLGGENAA